MQTADRTNSKIKIHFSFWVAAVLFFGMGLERTFLMITISVTAHELCHVLLARAFGCNTRKFVISAMGEMAYIPDIEKLTANKRALVILAGPACNLFLWFVTRDLNVGMFGFYNLILFVFNMLPLFPLDGARLLQLLLGNAFGVMRANRWILSSGQICCMALIILGVGQAILYAPNFTMLLAGLVFLDKNKKLQLELTGEFYMKMLSKLNKPVKIIKAKPNYNISWAVERMGWDYSLVVVLPNGKKISEKDILKKLVTSLPLNLLL